MTDKTLSRIIGGGGAKMIMPKLQLNASSLFMKGLGAATTDSTNSAFFDAINSDHTDEGYATTALFAVSNTLEQDILDTGTGVSGVLTQIRTPENATSGAIATVRVYIDGNDAIEFVLTLKTANNSVMVVGDIGDGTTATTLGAVSRQGYPSYSNQQLAYNSPVNSVLKGLPIGMIFEDSLRVTIQADNAWGTGDNTNIACVSRLTSIPEGLL